MSSAERIRVASATEIDAMVGSHVLGETPEIFWEESHGLLQFETEEEAWQAVRNSDYQLCLPEMDWTTTSVREVRRFPAYCSDSNMIWKVVGRTSTSHGPLQTRQERGRWYASFGNALEADGRTPLVAICLAALRAYGLVIEVDHDRLDAELNRLAAGLAAEENGSSLGLNGAGAYLPWGLHFLTPNR